MEVVAYIWFTDVLLSFIVFILIFYFWVKNKQSYWARRHILTPKPKFLIGNVWKVILQKYGFCDYMTEVYQHLRQKNVKHGGMYLFCDPAYVPIDLDLIKNILQNDFSHFKNRGLASNEQLDPLSAHLFVLEDVRWKNMRSKVTPTFTPGKLKMMCSTIVDCSEQLAIEMEKSVGGCIDVKEILSRFTTDVIGSVAFGIDCNSLKDPNTDFRKYGKMFFKWSLKEKMRDFLLFIYPNIMKYIPIRLISKELSNFFLGVVKNTVEYREKNNIHRKDFMHLLLQIKNRGKLEDDENVIDIETNQTFEYLTFNEVAAQAFLFFVAGFETSSTTMTFCLYHLALNVEIQDKLRQEIYSVLKRHKNQITYESISEMVYMEQIINETLRLFPPVPTLNRICTKDYQVPGMDFIIEKGTKIIIPITGIQRDETYFPEPDVFDPDRFSAQNKHRRHPCSFLPFGEGPRTCIGLRFGFMQVKIGLTALLRHYKFTMNSKTIVPVQMDPKSFVLSNLGGMWLNYTRVEEN